MTATCFSYVHVLHKKAAFIPDASIGVFRRNFITKPPANPADGPVKQRKDEYIVKA